jgi:hypothetical protein
MRWMPSRSIRRQAWLRDRCVIDCVIAPPSEGLFVGSLKRAANLIGPSQSSAYIKDVGSEDNDMNCPQCNRPMVHNGKKSSYAQRWRCKPCGKTVTDSQSSHGGHRHGAPGGTPDAERKRKSRERRKQQQCLLHLSHIPHRLRRPPAGDLHN